MSSFRNLRGLKIGGFSLGGSGLSVSSGGAPAFDFGKAIGLNGSNQYASLTSSLTSNSTTTISFWFKVNAFDSGNIFGNSGSNLTTVRATSSTNMRWFVASSKDFTVPTMSTGTRYHGVFTIDATNIRFYLNGVESSTGALAKTVDITIDQIGRYFNGGSGFWFGGEMDEIAIDLTRTLSGAEVSSLYNGGAGADYISTIGALNAYYKFNASDGTDSSGNSNTLTLFNSPTFPDF